jgi:hypothetical protein
VSFVSEGIALLASIVSEEEKKYLITPFMFALYFVSLTPAWFLNDITCGSNTEIDIAPVYGAQEMAQTALNRLQDNQDTVAEPFFDVVYPSNRLNDVRSESVSDNPTLH